MFHVEAELHLDAPHADVWQVVSDFGGHYLYNPYVRHSVTINDIPVGVGAEREVYLYDGSLMLQRIVDFDPAGSMAIEIVESDLLIRHYLLQMSVQAADDNASTLACRVSYLPPFGILGSPLALILKPVILSRVSHMLQGVAHYVRTREPIGNRVP